jgi:CubicO group peptidase (beta-lactamase class C family)
MHLPKFIYASSLFCFLLPGAVGAQSFTRLDDWLASNTERLGGRSVLMVYKNDRLVYTKAVNEMSTRQKLGSRLIARRLGKEANTEDFTPGSRIPIASCSKWLSAALVMTFVDEGKLKLSDTVGRFLPVLTQHGKGAITIDECLSHRTGIKAPELKESIAEMQNLTSMDEAIEKIAELPMEGVPGQVFHYSNAGLQIAAAVLEKISGQSFQQLFATRIATPLRMLHTDFGKAKVPLPAGGAWSTAEDYMNFLTMILHQGMFEGKRILSEQSIVAMQANRITKGVTIAYSPAEAGSWGYGYGEWVMEDVAAATKSEAVSSPGLFGSFPWIDYNKGYCAILLAYTIRNKGRHEKYAELKNLVDEAVR